MDPLALAGEIIFIAAFGILAWLIFRYVQRWEIQVAIDDGMTITYKGGKIKGRSKKDDYTYYIIEYEDEGRKHEVLVPDKPGYMRLMKFLAGLRKSVVFRVDKSGQPLSWETTAPVIPTEELEYIKTHEMIINALRTRIVYNRLWLYVIVIIVAVLVFAGLVTWQALNRPIEITVIHNTTASRPTIPPPG